DAGGGARVKPRAVLEPVAVGQVERDHRRAVGPGRSAMDVGGGDFPDVANLEGGADPVARVGPRDAGNTGAIGIAAGKLVRPRQPRAELMAAFFETVLEGVAE